MAHLVPDELETLAERLEGLCSGCARAVLRLCSGVCSGASGHSGVYRGCTER
jgi:hypothetical protein